MVSNAVKVGGVVAVGVGAYFLLRPKGDKKTISGGGGGVGSYTPSDGIILNETPAVTKKETTTTTATDPLTFDTTNDSDFTNNLIAGETKKSSTSLKTGLSPSAQKTATSLGIPLMSTSSGVQTSSSVYTPTKKQTSSFTGVFSSNRQTSSPRTFFRRLFRR